MVLDKIKRFLSSSRRVLIISTKPNWKDFGSMAKVTAIGIVVIAVAGFIVQLIFALLGIGY